MDNRDIVTRTGLVMEGGGLRALFTAGVLDVWTEAGITFHGMVGVSAGATIGCNFKSRQAGRALRYNIAFSHDPRYISWRNLWREGNMVGAEFSYHTMPECLDVFDCEAFQRNPAEFHLVCTDVATGRPVYHRIDRGDRTDMEWLRATASLPILSRPVELDGLSLLDGGLSDSIPLRYMQQQGYGRCVVVLTQPLGFRKSRMRLLPLLRLLLRRHPAVAQALAVRHQMYNAQLDFLAREAAQGRALVIAPQCSLSIGRLEQDEHKMRQVHAQGRQAALQHLQAVKAFLEGGNSLQE